MRVLDFTQPGMGESYEILYDGLTGSSRGFEAPSETRIVSRILDKLEEIGLPTERGGVKTFALVDGGGTVRLEDAEYSLMGEAIRSVKWTARAARKATSAMEWFASAPEPVKEKAKDDTPK